MLNYVSSQSFHTLNHWQSGTEKSKYIDDLIVELNFVYSVPEIKKNGIYSDNTEGVKKVSIPFSDKSVWVDTPSPYTWPYYADEEGFLYKPFSGYDWTKDNPKFWILWNDTQDNIYGSSSDLSKLSYTEKDLKDTTIQSGGKPCFVYAPRNAFTDTPTYGAQHFKNPTIKGNRFSVADYNKYLYDGYEIEYGLVGTDGNYYRFWHTGMDLLPLGYLYDDAVTGKTFWALRTKFNINMQAMFNNENTMKISINMIKR